MQKRSNHNSILFLTTLGVYLGLMLVGAPTGILAQPAATTRNFDISEEFEVVEDLDTKPDDHFTEQNGLDSKAFESTVANLVQSIAASPTSASYAADVSLTSTRNLPMMILPYLFSRNAIKSHTDLLLIGILPRSAIDPLLAV